MHLEEAFAHLHFPVGVGEGDALHLTFGVEDERVVELDGHLTHEHVAFLYLLAGGIFLFHLVGETL